MNLEKVKILHFELKLWEKINFHDILILEMQVMHSVALGLHCQLYRQHQYSTILCLGINPAKDRKLFGLLWPVPV